MSDERVIKDTTANPAPLGLFGIWNDDGAVEFA